MRRSSDTCVALLFDRAISVPKKNDSSPMKIVRKLQHRSLLWNCNVLLNWAKITKQIELIFMFNSDRLSKYQPPFLIEIPFTDLLLRSVINLRSVCLICLFEIVYLNTVKFVLSNWAQKLLAISVSIDPSSNEIITPLRRNVYITISKKQQIHFDKQSKTKKSLNKQQLICVRVEEKKRERKETVCLVID